MIMAHSVTFINVYIAKNNHFYYFVLPINTSIHEKCAYRPV